MQPLQDQQQHLEILWQRSLASFEPIFFSTPRSSHRIPIRVAFVTTNDFWPWGVSQQKQVNTFYSRCHLKQPAQSLKLQHFSRDNPYTRNYQVKWFFYDFVTNQTIRMKNCWAAVEPLPCDPTRSSAFVCKWSGLSKVPQGPQFVTWKLDSILKLLSCAAWGSNIHRIEF